MLVAPARRRMVMTRLRELAMTRGPLAVRTWERSSSKSMSGPVQPVLDPLCAEPDGECRS